MAQTTSTTDNTSTDNTPLLRVLSNQMADAVEQVTPALVLVNGRRGQGASGVVYAQDIVLTADHVLDRDTDITVETADFTYFARAIRRPRPGDRPGSPARSRSGRHTGDLHT